MSVLILIALSIVADVRQADLPAAEKLVAEYRAKHGVTTEYLAAYSWLGRKALAAKQYAAADKYAAETHKLALAQLKHRALDADAHLPIALGAAIEVQAQAAAARGERDQAVTFLREELKRYRNTSIGMRLEKNIHLLSLEGKPALPLQGVTARELQDRPTVLFLWAHWCGDCKSMAPAIARLRREFPDMQVIAPTQRFGYVEGGRDAGVEEESKYILKVWREVYGDPNGVRVVIDEETFRSYGVSTTPTLVLIDTAGIVRMYHPGRMSWEELSEAVRRLRSRGARAA
ncbi:MAG TPA: TlpA disulfide reductase family protein [Bryobacteraceae bacterium]|nr:TlpA disulfide reductase family protein [Bryobacteraceae bacterium]